jgi:UBX domain-containing protein 1
MMTLDELRKRAEHDDGEGGDGEGQSFYAGGEKSGMAVMGGGQASGGNPLVDQIMARAREQKDGQSAADGPSVFTGRAKKLTDQDDPTDSATNARGKYVEEDDEEEEEEVAVRTMTFWSDGFTIEPNLTLRSFTDPQSVALLTAIRGGTAPISELGLAPGQPVEMRVAHRPDEPFSEAAQKRIWKEISEEVERTRGKKIVKPFAGSGRRLGDVPDAPQSMQSAGKVPAGAKDESIGFKQGQPSTRIQFRLTNGTRHTIQFNLDQNIEEVYATARLLNGGTPVEQLLTGRPPAPIPADLKLRIREARLEGSLLIQK